MQKAWRIIAVLTFSLSIAAIAVCLVLGSCPKMIETAAGGSVPMKCHWTMRVCTMLTAFATLMGVLQFFVKEKGAKVISAASTVTVAVCVLLTCSNIVIGVCGKEDMLCRTTTLWVRIIMVVLIVVELVGVYITTRVKHPSKMF